MKRHASRSDWFVPGLPVVVGVLLALPRIGLGYFWDDYIFLTSAQANPFSFLLPNPTTIYFRPISMGLYFLALLPLGPFGSIVGHVLNLILLALSIVLVELLAKRTAGKGAALFAGLTYAALFSMPSLVAWTTASQDLLAIVFLLLAFNLRQAGKTWGSLACAACALLSKEPAIALVPALVLWDWAMGRKPPRLAFHGLLFGGLAVVWAGINPGIHEFFIHGFQSPATGYVGVERPERWALYVGRYLLAVLNIPFTGVATPWPRDLTGIAVGSVTVLSLGLWILRGRIPALTTPDRIGHWRLLALSGLMILPPVLLYTVLVKHWAPYYVSLPGIGAALLIGTLLSRAPRWVASALLVGFLLIGVWSRGLTAPQDAAFTERSFVEASRAIRLLEDRFRQLRPSLPHESRVYLSISQTGALGIFQTMQQGQAIRIWYDDPTLRTLLPQLREDGSHPELLFRITSSLDVVEIDPDRCLYRSSVTGAPLDPEEIGMPIRTFARGVAASGEWRRSAQILEQVAQLDRGIDRVYDLRLAAMALFANGASREAQQILSSQAPFSREDGLASIMKVLAEPTRSATLDSSAYQAFGISPSDPSAVRELMRGFRDNGYPAQALHFALRLEAMVPGDSEAKAVIERSRR